MTSLGLIHISFCLTFLGTFLGFPGPGPSRIFFFLFCPGIFPGKTRILPLNQSKQQSGFPGESARDKKRNLSDLESLCLENTEQR